MIRFGDDLLNLFFKIGKGYWGYFSNGSLVVSLSKSIQAFSGDVRDGHHGLSKCLLEFFEKGAGGSF